MEFTHLKVADIVQYSESDLDNQTFDSVILLYAIDKTVGAGFLTALDLADGKGRYENADSLDSTKYFYQSDVLINALNTALEANATTVKNALESYVDTNGGVAMSLTAFMQTTLLYLGLLTFPGNMLLGLGIMLAANEVPRIAQQFGLDSSVKVNMMSVVHATTTAANITRSLVRAK